MNDNSQGMIGIHSCLICPDRPYICCCLYCDTHTVQYGMYIQDECKNCCRKVDTVSQTLIENDDGSSYIAYDYEGDID